MLVLFGVAVLFKPSQAIGRVDKPLSTGLQGIFLGYRFAPGGTWNGEYLVVRLGFFAGLDVAHDAVGHCKTLVPHVTKQIRVPEARGFTFPLKDNYNKVNFTLKGVRVAALRSLY